MQKQKSIYIFVISAAYAMTRLKLQNKLNTGYRHYFFKIIYKYNKKHVLSYPVNTFTQMFDYFHIKDLKTTSFSNISFADADA